jgi:clan AA aspartic protease (TIGR02281 family)
MHQHFSGPGRPGRFIGWVLCRAAPRLIGGLALCLIADHSGFLVARADEGAVPSVPGVMVLRGSSGNGTAVPSAPGVTVLRPPPEPALLLHAGRDGHVSVDALVNGTPTRMAFDTGASVVSLTQADAERSGVSKNLHYTIPFGTANGQSYGAPVTLRVRIGQHEIDDVQAVVMPNLNVSLLGQSFLSRLRSYEMRDGVLTLTW